jgi:acylphosphatase
MAFTSIDFEVFGHVQGVFFRYYTEEKARQLQLVGWCQNTRLGTVRGTVQGLPEGVATMRSWLRKEGSPRSVVERVEFSNERKGLEKLEYAEFAVRR